MKKSLFVVFAFAFLLLCCLSCQEEPTAVQSDVSYQQASGGFAKGKPVGDREAPQIVSLSVMNSDGIENASTRAASLPGEPVKIQYTVTDNVAVTEITVYIIYDENKDGKWEILFAEHVYITTVNGTKLDGPGEITWDGSVNRQSQYPFPIFDHLATTNPDEYIVYFTAKDGANNTASNWHSYGDLTVGTDLKVYVNPAITAQGFHIESISASATRASSRKSKYVAQLSAVVACNAPQFRGGGQWRQWDETNQVWGPLTNYDGCPNGGLYGGESGVATASCSPLVNKGLYRFYVKILYHPSLSYDPEHNADPYRLFPYDEEKYLDYTFAQVEVQ